MNQEPDKDLLGETLQPETASVGEPAPAEKKPQSKERIRGVVKSEIDGEEYKVEMRSGGVTVRRCKKKHVDFKKITDIIDFVIGQERLPLEDTSKPNPQYIPGPQGMSFFTPLMHQQLYDACNEYIEAWTDYQNDPKLFGRYSFAFKAMREIVEKHQQMIETK